ncbi:hypothetical protein ACIQOF_33885 [Streptomyces sp. NPDC091265]|uniref:hypothetical protein n=1 Tax=unclassified Streptomyces TaxID=2593676 RepID=UPI00344F6A3C
MRALLPFLIATACFAVVLSAFAWLAAHIRRRGLAGSAMSAALASYEEAFRITAHESHVEVQAQAERKSPLLSPDDHWQRGEAGQDPAENHPAGNRRIRPASRPRHSRLGLRRRVGRIRAGRGKPRR